MLVFYAAQAVVVDLDDLNLDEAPDGVAVTITSTAASAVDARIYWHLEKTASA